jgi:hypothetical protein
MEKTMTSYTCCRPADADVKRPHHLVRDQAGRTHTRLWRFDLDCWEMPLPGGQKYWCAGNMSSAGFTYVGPA